jgi:transcriptional regulator with XRE-family HTH domain
MAPGETGHSGPGVPPKAPNSVLRHIREQERHETREQFAESMARMAREIGAPVIPDAKYAARLESGDIRYPGPVYRRILAQLCGRPFGELGFSPPPGLSLADRAGSGGATELTVPDSVVVSASKRRNMALRDAILASGLELSQIARAIGVDPKSVQRWVTSGVVPHPRHRWKVCEVLGQEESRLWPDGGGTERVKPSVPVPGRPISLGDPVPSPSIAELSAVITDYDFRPGQWGSVHHDDVPSLGDLERDLEVAFCAYQQARFATAASRVSMLLADAQLAARECRTSDRARALTVLALAYQAAAAVLTKAGGSDIAWIAAERGLNAAESATNPSVRGSLIRSVAFALLSTGRCDAAMRVVEAGADYMRGEISRNDTALSVYGTLLLVGSLAAARFGDGSETADYLRESGAAAQRLGRDANHLWTAFGPTNIAIHRVNTAVELGDIQTVLDADPLLDISAVPAERRARYFLDIARAQSLAGNQADALGTMLTAERIAPEQVRQHYLGRQVVMTLIRSTRAKPSVELEKLARRVRVREVA